MQHEVDRRRARCRHGARAVGVMMVGAMSTTVVACGTHTDVDVAAPTTSVASLSPTAPPTTSPPSTTLDCDDSTDQVALLERTYRELPGVDPELVSLDVYGPLPPPGCPPVPVVVDVHGGNFRRGDKADHLGAKVDVLNGAGYAVVAINYRLVDDERSGEGAGVYPAQADDIAAAVRWVVDHADAFGADPERIAIMGTAAGAFLAAQQATDPVHLQSAGVAPQTVQCVALLDPEPLDVPSQIDADTDRARLYRMMFGDDPDVWAAASPQRGAEDGSVTADVLIVTRGSQERTAHSRWFAGTLEAAGVGVDVVHAGGLATDLESRIGAADDTVVTPALLGFLGRCL